MRVLIVARTRMHGPWRCIGGLDANNDSVRLLTAAGTNCDTSAPFQVGEAWDITYAWKPNAVSPHVEDVLVSAQKHVGTQPGLRAHLLQHVTPWQGGIDQLFGGMIDYTASGNGYISERTGVPDRSTGFWTPDRELRLRGDGKHYDYVKGSLLRGLSYVGEAAAVARIPAGTLVRVSLARWWKPDDADPDFEERCYLQLSGWY